MVDSGKGTTLQTEGDTEIVSKQLISLKKTILTYTHHSHLVFLDIM